MSWSVLLPPSGAKASPFRLYLSSQRTRGEGRMLWRGRLGRYTWQHERSPSLSRPAIPPRLSWKLPTLVNAKAGIGNTWQENSCYFLGPHHGPTPPSTDPRQSSTVPWPHTSVITSESACIAYILSDFSSSSVISRAGRTVSTLSAKFHLKQAFVFLFFRGTGILPQGRWLFSLHKFIYIYFTLLGYNAGLHCLFCCWNHSCFGY